MTTSTFRPLANSVFVWHQRLCPCMYLYCCLQAIFRLSVVKLISKREMAWAEYVPPFQSAWRRYVFHTFSCPHRKFRVYFVATTTLRHALMYELSTYARLLYHVCDHACNATLWHDPVTDQPYGLTHIREGSWDPQTGPLLTPLPSLVVVGRYTIIIRKDEGYNWTKHTCTQYLYTQWCNTGSNQLCNISCPLHTTFSIHSTTARLYGSPVVSVYGAGPSKVIRPREGHAGK